MGVRRVVRLLEVGDVAKRMTDAAIDANSQLLNLRMSILKWVQGLGVGEACEVAEGRGTDIILQSSI